MKKRLQIIRMMVKASKGLEADKKINPALLQNFRSLIQTIIDCTKEFIDSLPPDLKKFVNYYYFSAESKAYCELHSGNGISCYTCRKAVERAADRWVEKQ